jgi:phage baseplate assembly protein W
MKKIVNYRDLDLNFNRHPLTNDVTQLTDSESIKRALKNLLSLKRYEKPFHPEINSGIRDSLFENVSLIHLDAIRTAIFQIVQKYEQRVKLNDVVILPNLDGNSYDVSLMYTVLNTQTPTNFKFVLTRSR